MNTQQAQKLNAIALWLFGVAGLVFVMVVVGAITRLTESGLSMVEWRPLIGALPPINESEWQRVFELYKQSPEFQKKTFWMELGDFKTIFFWEWFHRFLGRFIGIAYGLPLIYFWITKRIPKGYGLKLFLMLILGGLQGLMGWYMVKSGLVDIPSVSHYRLAAHLGLAFLIFALLIWLGLSVMGAARKPDKSLHTHALLSLGVVILTIFWGAYTAGLDAGLIYNEYPLMGGQFVPPDFLHLTPAWLNVFENPSAVQFMHRWLAGFAFLAVLSVWVKGHKYWKDNIVLTALGFVVLIQFGLGIATLLSGVNITLAALHQANALVLLLCLVMTLYTFKPQKS